VNRPRAADDFARIRARMEELRRERKRAQAAEGVAEEAAVHRGRTPSEEISTGPRRVGQSGLGKRLDRDRPWWARPE
jgi:hypothetical protein